MPETPPQPPRFTVPMHLAVGPLTLTRLTAADGPDLYDAVSSSLAHLRPWMTWARDFSMATVEEFVESAAVRDDGPVSDAPYVVRDRSGALLGTCGLHARLGPDALEIGYWVAAAHIRRGVTSLAAAALTAAAFEVAGVERVEIHHDRANHASAGVPMKLGYELVGTEPFDAATPAASGEHWHWRMVREAWPTSTGAAILRSARKADMAGTSPWTAPPTGPEQSTVG